MSEQQLRTSLAALRSELDRLEAEEHDVRERLDALATAIEMHVEAPDRTEHHDSLVQELRQSILSLEVTHPRTTAILNQITAALANIGT